MMGQILFEFEGVSITNPGYDATFRTKFNCADSIVYYCQNLDSKARLERASKIVKWFFEFGGIEC